MGTMEKCLHQVFKSKPIGGIKSTIGCAGCTYDSINNPKCSEYSPLKMEVLEVEEIKEEYNVKS